MLSVESARKIKLLSKYGSGYEIINTWGVFSDNRSFPFYEHTGIGCRPEPVLTAGWLTN
jgi:hypothetical protein